MRAHDLRLRSRITSTNGSAMMMVVVVMVAAVVAVVEGFVLICPPTPPRVSLVLLLLLLLRLRLLLLPLLPLLPPPVPAVPPPFTRAGSQFAGVPHQPRVSSNGATSPASQYLFRRVFFFFRQITSRAFPPSRFSARGLRLLPPVPLGNAFARVAPVDSRVPAPFVVIASYAARRGASIRGTRVAR